uniref:Uncharacterized protein n=2 Tax=Myripristis murdjan TaxID=586833 RepID=A0A667X2S0_9TELE
MPFIPPVTIARPRSVSVLGLTGRERPMNSTSSTATLAKNKTPAEDKGGSVKERLTLNLKQLGKKSQPRSHLPTSKRESVAELHVRTRDRLLSSSQTLSSSLPGSSSGESLSKVQQHGMGSRIPVRSEPVVKTGVRHQEEALFTLTLTPEAVVLLQRRSNERLQRLAARNAGSGAGITGNNTESRRRRDNLPKRHQAATRHGTPNSRVTVKASASDGEPGDISSLLKISLLNEQYKYDDVEYEEEEDCGVDERVVLKCTEWLRGLENAPVTVGNSFNTGASSLKSF